jgi:histidine transporter
VFVIAVLGYVEDTRVSLYVGIVWIILMSALWQFVVRPQKAARQAAAKAGYPQPRTLSPVSQR